MCDGIRELHRQCGDLALAAVALERHLRERFEKITRHVLAVHDRMQHLRKIRLRIDRET